MPISSDKRKCIETPRTGKNYNNGRTNQVMMYKILNATVEYSQKVLKLKVENAKSF